MSRLRERYMDRRDLWSEIVEGLRTLREGVGDPSCPTCTDQGYVQNGRGGIIPCPDCLGGYQEDQVEPVPQRQEDFEVALQALKRKYGMKDEAIKDPTGTFYQLPIGYAGCPDCEGSGLAFSKIGMGKPCQRCRDRQDASGAAQPSGLFDPDEDNGCGVCGGTGWLRGKPCQYCPDEDGW